MSYVPFLVKDGENVNIVEHGQYTFLVPIRDPKGEVMVLEDGTGFLIPRAKYDSIMKSHICKSKPESTSKSKPKSV